MWEVTEEKSRIQQYGELDPDLYKQVTDQEHWLYGSELKGK